MIRAIFFLFLLVFYADIYAQLSPIGLLLRANGRFEVITEAALHKPDHTRDSVFIFNRAYNSDTVKTTIFDLETKYLKVNAFLLPALNNVTSTETDLNNLKDIWEYTGTIPDTMKQHILSLIRKEVPEIDKPGLRIRHGQQKNYYIDGQPVKSTNPTYSFNKLISYGYSEGRLASVLCYDSGLNAFEFDSLVYLNGRLAEVYNKSSFTNRKMSILYNRDNKVQTVQTIYFNPQWWDGETSSTIFNYVFKYDSQGYINAVTEIYDGQAHTMQIRKR